MFSRITPLARHVAVASVSLLLVVSAIGYMLSPVEQALAATVSSHVTKANHESIEGKIQSKWRGFVIRVTKRVHGRTIVVANVKLGRRGKFDVSVRPGVYQVTVKHGSLRMTKRVKVAKGRSDFVAVKVIKSRGGFGIAPVIFNY